MPLTSYYGYSIFHKVNNKNKENNSLGTHCEIALKWLPPDLTDELSTLIQVMAWCRQATSHYLSQCWLISLSPYGIIRPQWVNMLLVIRLHWLVSFSRKCSQGLYSLSGKTSYSQISWSLEAPRLDVRMIMVPNGTRQLPEPMFSYHQWSFVAFNFITQAVTQE